MDSVNGEKKPPRLGWGRIVLGVVSFVFLYSLISNASSDDSGLDEGALVVACQNVVEKNLKSPSSADFVGVPQVDGMYIVGQVDAENAFGAKLRASFRCTIIDEETVRLDFLR